MALTRTVTLADVGLVNAVLSQVVSAANYLRDVNVSGTLILAAKGITNGDLTHVLPTPWSIPLQKYLAAIACGGLFFAIAPQPAVGQTPSRVRVRHGHRARDE
jgi:hypothetical protein